MGLILLADVKIAVEWRPWSVFWDNGQEGDELLASGYQEVIPRVCLHLSSYGGPRSQLSRHPDPTLWDPNRGSGVYFR